MRHLLYEYLFHSLMYTLLLMVNVLDIVTKVLANREWINPLFIGDIESAIISISTKVSTLFLFPLFTPLLLIGFTRDPNFQVS